ncbi:MAG: hypothetical protein DPW11_00805 [bacterium]|nr:hypothetical protein [Candidatus Microgenomates bacterium CPR3]MCQ3944307.1 hypothetical protein [bacterium]RIK51023.1 MAG: hypothetical protein DCC61_03885 [Candidatus Microgenomates bacterium]
MLSSIVITTTIALLCTLAGLPYSSHLRGSLLLRVGLSYLIGSGIATFLLFMLHRALGVPLNFQFALLSFAFTWLFGYLTRSPEAVIVTIKRSHLNYVPVLIIITAFLIGSYLPLTAWDSLALYDFRAHAIAITHSLEDMTKTTYDMSYPLHISILHSFVYMLGGESAQGLHALFFGGLLAVIYERLLAWTNPRWAILGTILVAVSHELFDHATFAYTNLPYTAYLISGLLYLLGSTRRELLIGSILIGLSSWTRSAEPFWLLAWMLLAYQSLKLKDAKSLFMGSLLLYGIRYGWTQYYNQIVSGLMGEVPSLNTSLSLNSLLALIPKIPSYYWYMRLNVIDPYRGYWFLILLMVLVWFKTRDIRLGLFFLLSFATLGGVIIGTILFSLYIPTWADIGTSARRMVLFIIPLTLIGATYAIYIINSKKYDQ